MASFAGTEVKNAFLLIRPQKYREVQAISEKVCCVQKYYEEHHLQWETYFSVSNYLIVVTAM